MKKPSTNVDINNADRMWSDDQGYMDTLAWLINKSHEASMDSDQDVYDWFWILEQLQLEIVGQLVNRDLTEDIDRLQKLRKKTRIALDETYKKVGHLVGKLSPCDASNLRDIVYPYNHELQIIIHKLDLRLHQVTKKDVGNNSSSTWSKYTM